MENLSSSDTERHHTVSLPKQPSPDVFPPLEVSLVTATIATL